MGDGAESPLAEAMNRLWAKHLPQMEERVATLQNAAERLASGTLTQNDQEHASADAHRLAGVLGTFGLTEGTELAREAEVLYGEAADPDKAARLFLIAKRLKSMVANRGHGS